jgi:hypothetical protein
LFVEYNFSLLARRSQSSNLAVLLGGSPTRMTDHDRRHAHRLTAGNLLVEAATFLGLWPIAALSPGTSG